MGNKQIQKLIFKSLEEVNKQFYPNSPQNKQGKVEDAYIYGVNFAKESLNKYSHILDHK